MLKAVQRADILSNIFSPFMFSVVPTASNKVAVPTPETSRVVFSKGDETRSLARTFRFVRGIKRPRIMRGRRRMPDAPNQPSVSGESPKAEYEDFPLLGAKE